MNTTLKPDLKIARLKELKELITPKLKEINKILTRIDLLKVKKDIWVTKEKNEYNKKVGLIAVLKKELAPLRKEEEELIERHTIKKMNEYEYNTSEFTIDELNRRYERSLSDEFDVDDSFSKGAVYVPDYQREFVWSDNAQSKFIESLILGIPVPLIFFADVNSHLEIVDGSQRIRTIHNFISGNLKLDGLEKLTYLNGYRYNDLPMLRQNRIDDLSLRAVSLGRNTLPTARYDLFERVNTGGDNLKSAEKRKGSVVSDYSRFIEECSKNELFMELCPLGEKVANRGEGIERITRFFAYSGEGALDKYNGKVTPFLQAFLKAESDKFDEVKKEEMTNQFNRMLNFVNQNFPNGFKKYKESKSTFRVRFEAISLGVDKALDEQPKLQVANVNWIDSESFYECIRSDAANNKSKLLKRIDYVADKLLGR
ncbi:DUF262 domain-containing protein [uncultured Psychromonas sp.]|uniref:DUF262 domain-containing protein n=1 Tax=uncultured Psychromonas sp. TaxID=173974 RepID=UPI00260C41A4|nr:DUF262 domain-containing protein [uncultured Psychromonas sp.]